MTIDAPVTEATMAPADCPDMPTLRSQIDRVDRALVALLAERLGYIERAAVIKSVRGSVRDDARVADVIAKVCAEAAKRGLPPDLAERLWRELVERSIAHEFQKFDAKA